MIRRLTSEDSDRYVAVRKLMLVTDPFSFLGAPGDDVGCDPAFMRQQLAREEYAIFAAAGPEETGELLAVAGIVRESRKKLAHRAGIWGVYTRADSRGQGLARAVVARCIDAARTWDGVDIVGLSVSVRAEGAQRLYRSLGFVAWGTQPDSLRVDGEPESEIYMQLSLRR